MNAQPASPIVDNGPVDAPITAWPAAAVLVVNDRESQRIAIRAMLAPLGLVIIEADSGPAALRAVLRQSFAVIVMDVRMPTMDGYETAELIRQHDQSRQTPIIFATAHGRDEVETTAAYANGAVDFIFTPIHPEMLRAKISAFVNLYSQSQEAKRSLASITVLNEALRKSEARAVAMLQEVSEGATAKVEADLAKVVAESEVVKRAQERVEELKQSDEDLSRSEGRGEHERARLLSFFELSQDMLCTVDAQGFFVDLNPAWQQALGYTGVQLRAQPFIELVHPGDRERTTAEVAAIFEGNVTVDFDNRFLANDGSVRCFRWSSVLGGDGMIYARATDVTAKLEAETEVVKRAEELKRSNDDLMQFAFIASHDLNEPLRTIGGFAQLLERRYEAEVDARGRDYIKRMVGGVTRMQALIADLLMFSRAGREETDPESLDSSALAEEVLADLHQAIVDRGAVVEVGKLPQLVVNRKDLQQVLQNLISNALKFANGKTTRIEISADRIAAGWSFAVADNGIGIDERQRERIFGAFERLHNRDEYAGTGIGLAICKRIIEHRGGQIGVESGLDGGSRFVFTVPDAEPARAA